MKKVDEDFVYQITDWQNRLFGYLVTLLGNVHDARDVLQETNLVLWRKAGEGEEIRDFGAWAKRCAQFQALAFLRDRKRDRHVFDEETMMRLIDDEAAEQERAPDDEERSIALRDCLAGMAEDKRRLLRERYQEERSIRELATGLGKKESAIKMKLMRLRKLLLGCMEGKLRELKA